VCRKPLGFQDLSSHLEKLLSEGETPEELRGKGRLGPQPVVLDHTSGFEGLLFVDDDLLGVSRVRLGKWAYEVLISSQGLMQIGWCTLSCRFNQEEGVGDTPDSYAYDGNRVRKWNVTTTNYGKSWAAGDIVSCLIDLDEGTITFCLNGQSLGTAFSSIKTGPGVAYFPAISLSFKESVAFNFGSRPLRYPSRRFRGYLPLQDPPTADLLKAHRLLGYIKNVLSTSIDTQVTRPHSGSDPQPSNAATPALTERSGSQFGSTRVQDASPKNKSSLSINPGFGWKILDIFHQCFPCDSIVQSDVSRAAILFDKRVLQLLFI
uniref:B30.2/SPRY domain-containing protein n=1 Tax=Poecilia mexicana TaxID=48701 RepID=A0A3B3YX26_9TELE